MEQQILQQPDLGEVPDRVIAARLGCSLTYVQLIRVRYEIEPCRTHGRSLPGHDALYLALLERPRTSEEARAIWVAHHPTGDAKLPRVLHRIGARFDRRRGVWRVD